MKKKLFILSAIFAALFSSCNEETPIGIENSLTGTTTVVFTPDFGNKYGVPGTKAFADNPQVQNLYLAVFTEGGKALVEYVKANPVTLATENEPGEYTYSATLTLSDQPRVIHFIANGPEKLNYGSEEDAIGSLIYSFDKTAWTGQDAYWGYLELPNGICNNSNTTGFQALCTALSSVKLVRNFARINVTSSATNLTVTRFWISNFPDCSSVAPYNRDGRQFETDYADYEYATDAIDAGYNGFSPVSSGLVSISGLTPSELNEIDVPCAPDKYAYVYECEKPVKDALCVIVAGYYDGSSEESFYKLEIRDEDGKYLPILRDFTYTLNIGKVEKEGESSVENALNSVPSGGIDTNLDLQSLPDLSNGRSRIAVSYTDTTLISNDGIEFEYLFVPDIVNAPDVVVNQTLDYLITSGGYANEAAVQADPLHPSYVTISSESGVTGNVIDSYTVGTSDKTDGYRVIDLSPVAVSEVVKTEVFTVVGHVYNTSKGKYETIQRTVSYQMRQRPGMVLKLNPNKVLASKVGEPLLLSIGVEENLPKSLFTLEMRISTEQGTLTPAGQDLPITSGVGTDGKPTYFITKSIDWDDFKDATSVTDKDGVVRKYFDCQLMTNTKLYRDVSALIGQGDRIIVTSDKLQSANIVFLAGNDAFYKFVNPHFDKDYLAAGRPAHIVFGMTELPEDGTVFVRMSGIEPVDKNALKYQREDGDYTVWEMNVSDSNSESVEIVPKAEANIGYFQLVDDDFNSSAIYDKEVKKLSFSSLKLGINNEDYVVIGREAQAKFHMDYPPLDGKVTIHLKNCTPVDNTLTGTGPDANGYTAYEITAATNDISFPVKINTGVTTASFKLTDSEFYDSSVMEASVSKLQFSNVGFINGTLDYLLSNGTATQQLTFTLGDRPTTGTGNVILYLKGVTVNDLTSTGTGTGTYAGYDKYELNMADATAYPSLTVTLDITPKLGATSASVLLSHSAEFKDSDVKTVNIKTRYTIDWSKVLIKSDDSGNPAQGNTAVSVYTTSDCTGTAFKSFTTTTNPAGYGPNSAGSDNVDSEDGANVLYYFKFTKGGVDYISDGVSLKYLAETDPAEVICKIQKSTWTVNAGNLTVMLNGSACNGGSFTYTTSFESGGPIYLTNGNPKGENKTAFTITYKSNENISITLTDKDSVNHTKSFTIDQIKSGTINF